MILRAGKYVYTLSPYFLPSEAIIFSLQTAALAGIDVRLMLPEKSDSKLMSRASSSFIDEMLRAGVKVYLFQDGFLHAKMVVSDDEVCTCGSTNMDFRSFEHNFEVNAFIYNRDTAVEFKTIFKEYQHKSRLLNLHAWEKRSRSIRVCESLIRLLSPVL